MYCVISWDISAVNPRWQQINERLLGCINNYLYVRPVNTFYLVKISSSADIAQIQAYLNTARESTSENVMFILSPAFSGHSWLGTVSDWAGVNVITQA